MKLVAIIAENPGAALIQVHEQLGPDAVIVSVRKIRPEGIPWPWQSKRIEVTACVPAKPAAVSEPRPPLENHRPLRNENSRILPAHNLAVEKPVFTSSGRRWRSIGWLESNGLLPAFTKQLEDKVQVLYGEQPLPSMQTEWTAITDLIICHWLPSRQTMTDTGRPHVFIGPPGSGKTTALCKWMMSAVLLNENRLRVWRLDGETPNSSELLTLHCELAGVPLERFWREQGSSEDLQLVDIPGIEPNNQKGMSALQEQLSALPQPRIHLVLNAAYESSILLEQYRAFEPFAPEDIIFTHLDEEQRRVKLWNFVLGTKCPISFLGAGQKIPGDFRRAEPVLLFPQKSGANIKI